MDDLLTCFLQSEDTREVMDSAVQLSARAEPDDVPHLLAALHHPLKERRWGAVYALGIFSREDRRVTPLLIDVLLDSSELIWIRSEAAECLGYQRQQRALKPLIRTSRHASPDLRFWSVFALGQVAAFKRKQLPRKAIRALEARLGDYAKPEKGKWWSIHHEALAMLADNGSHRESFQVELNRVLADPITQADLWPWASNYASAEQEAEAIEKITAAGLDAVTLGRKSITSNEK